MYTLIAQNQYGQAIELTHNPAYEIKSISGLDPPDAVINTARNGTADGGIYKSAYMTERVITITLAVNGPAESNRIALYRYFKSKSPVRIFYMNGTRNVFIDGYTRSMPISYFDVKQVVQIIIQCPDPHFNNVTSSIQEYQIVENLFEFPFSIAEAGTAISELRSGVERSIVNDGDLEVGVQITMAATGAVTNPKIFDTSTNTSMIFDITLAAGDLIEIDTREGHKAAYLTSGGVRSPIIGNLRYGSSWFILLPGDNIFLVDADSGGPYLLVAFTVTAQFEGV